MAEGAKSRTAILSVALVLAVCTSWQVGALLAPTPISPPTTTPTSSVVADINPVGPTQSRPVIIETAQAAQATVRVRSSGTPATIGSGFVVGKCVFTNSHVVGGHDGFGLEPWAANGQSAISTMSATTITDSPNHDIAIGRIGPARGPLEDSAGLTLASENVMAGQSVAMLGFEFGKTLKAPTARVQALVDGTAYGYEGKVLLLDGLTVGGFSGGPVINDAGEVVGMLSGYDYATELAIAVPVSSLREIAADLIATDALESCHKHTDELA